MLEANGRREQAAELKEVHASMADAATAPLGRFLRSMRQIGALPADDATRLAIFFQKTAKSSPSCEMAAEAVRRSENGVAGNLTADAGRRRGMAGCLIEPETALGIFDGDSLRRQRRGGMPGCHYIAATRRDFTARGYGVSEGTHVLQARVASRPRVAPRKVPRPPGLTVREFR